MDKIIGKITTYKGTDYGMAGYKVRIAAVFKGCLRPDYDADADGNYITDDRDLEAAGGVTADDRVEVYPWLEKEGRYSWVSSDPRAIDLACFEDLDGDRR